MPLQISVITAVYNNAPTVGDAVQSMLEQQWPHVDHTVIDGGSTDGSLQMQGFLDGHDGLVFCRMRALYPAQVAILKCDLVKSTRIPTLESRGCVESGGRSGKDEV
jgi:cellulose synthase/poly-beta-1,6-N-acetylglucosamine synthase-like glycosyltransferase